MQHQSRSARRRARAFGPAVAEDVCERLRQGSSLAEIGRMVAMPSERTLRRWLRLHPRFAEVVRTARAAAGVQTRPAPALDRAAAMAAVCERLAAGQSLTRICRDKTMPGRATVHQWRLTDTGFAQTYARARAIQAESLLDEALDIADGEGGDVARARLRIDTRKWIVGLLAPGAGGRPGEEIEQLAAQVMAMTPEERRARLAALVARMRGGADN